MDADAMLQRRDMQDGSSTRLRHDERRCGLGLRRCGRQSDEGIGRGQDREPQFIAAHPWPPSVDPNLENIADSCNAAGPVTISLININLARPTA